MGGWKQENSGTDNILLLYCRDCRDLQEWPERWMGVEKNLLVGRGLVEFFMPFLLQLAKSGLSKRTIQTLVDNMWLLGGEIIRDVDYDPSLKKVAAEQLVRNVIHEDGGPLIHNGWGRRAALLRLHLPEILPLPHSIPALNPATHPQIP